PSERPTTNPSSSRTCRWWATPLSERTTVRPSSRMWIPGFEVIASKMRPRTSVPVTATRSLPEESSHVNQEKNRHLDPRHDEQRHARSGQDSEDQKWDDDPFAEGDSEGADEKQEGPVPVTPERPGSQHDEGGREDDEHRRRHGVLWCHHPKNPSTRA